MSTPDHRIALVTQLRTLSALLEANPELPLRGDSLTVCHFATRATDAEMRAEVDRIAALLGTEINQAHLPYGHYTTTLDLGRVRYEATAILASARARHDAQESYRDNVITDPAHAA